MHAVIVDDEPLARALIREFLDTYDKISIVAECSNGKEAVSAINERCPDLVFLDIKMPGLNGFEVIDHLEHIPQIVFSTANEERAIAAFETGAIDYLLKPYNKVRFDKAMQRVLDNRHLRLEREALKQIFRSMDQPASYPDHLFVRISDKIIPVALADVNWVEAAGDYSTLHTDRRTFICSQGIGSLEKRLDPAQFMRVHRSTIIAIKAITHIVSDGEGGYRVTLAGKTMVRVSRSYAQKVRNLIV